LPKEDLEGLRNQIPSHAANVTFFVAALSFVYSHIARLIEAGMSYSDAVASTVAELEKEATWGDRKAVVQGRFLKLFSPEIHQRARKLQRLQSGFIPNAIGFSTLVDLRPDFGEGPDLVLNGYLPVIQFRVTTDSNNPPDKRLVFQVNENALGEMRKALERAEQKLATLKRQSILASQIVKV
jgi:hypothetical protein